MNASVARAAAAGSFAAAVAAAVAAPALSASDPDQGNVVASRSVSVGVGSQVTCPRDAVPEPGNLALLLAGLGACACTALRRRA